MMNHTPYSVGERCITVTTTCGAPPMKVKNIAELVAATSA